MITRALYLYKLIRFSRQDCVDRISILGRATEARALPASDDAITCVRQRSCGRTRPWLQTCAFLLRGKWRKFDMPLFPGFLASLRLRPAYKLQQTAGAPAEIDVISGGTFPWLRKKTVRVHRVENQLPLQIFLAGQHKRYRFIMGINQQQKRVVTDWFTFEAEHVHHIAAEQHPQAPNEWRCPLFL